MAHAMKHLVLLASVSSVLFAGACKKKDGGGAATGSGSAAPAAAKAEEAKPAGCPAGAWKEPSGLFCVDMQGYTNVSPSDNGDSDPQQLEKRVTFKKPQDPSKPDIAFTVSWFPNRDDANDAIGAVANMESDYKNNKGEDKGDFASGKGKFFVYTSKDDPKLHKLIAVIQGHKHSYECEASSYDGPIPPEALAGCKSVTPTD